MCEKLANVTTLEASSLLSSINLKDHQGEAVAYAGSHNFGIGRYDIQAQRLCGSP